MMLFAISFLLLLASLFLLVLGLISPSLIQSVTRRKLSRKQVGVVFTCLALLFLLLAGRPTTPSPTPTKPDQQVPQAVKNIATPTLVPSTPTQEGNFSDQERAAGRTYTTQVMSLIKQYLVQYGVMVDSFATFSASRDLVQLRSDAESTLAVFKSIQQQLNAVTPPSILADAHAHITLAVGYTVQADQQVIDSVDSLDSGKMQAGKALMNQADAELKKATELISTATNQ